MSKFGENGQMIFALKVSKYYFSYVYGHKFGQNVINGSIWSKYINFGENGQTWIILVAKMTS